MTHKHSHSSLGLRQLLHHQFPPRTGVEGGVGGVVPCVAAAWHAFLLLDDAQADERLHLAGETLMAKLGVRGGSWRSMARVSGSRGRLKVVCGV